MSRAMFKQARLAPGESFTFGFGLPATSNTTSCAEQVPTSKMQSLPRTTGLGCRGANARRRGAVLARAEAATVVVAAPVSIAVTQHGTHTVRGTSRKQNEDRLDVQVGGRLVVVGRRRRQQSERLMRCKQTWLGPGRGGAGGHLRAGAGMFARFASTMAEMVTHGGPACAKNTPAPAQVAPPTATGEPYVWAGVYDGHGKRGRAASFLLSAARPPGLYAQPHDTGAPLDGAVVQAAGRWQIGCKKSCSPRWRGSGLRATSRNSP